MNEKKRFLIMAIFIFLVGHIAGGFLLYLDLTDPDNYGITECRDRYGNIIIGLECENQPDGALGIFLILITWMCCLPLFMISQFNE